MLTQPVKWLRRPSCLSIILLFLTTYACSATRELGRLESNLQGRDSVEPIAIENFQNDGPVTVILSSLHFSVEITPISIADCDQEHHRCYQRCRSRMPPYPHTPGSGGHTRYCSELCLAEYMKCLGENSLSYTFSCMAEAAAWLYKHRQETVGALIVLGTAAFIATTDGAGIFLVPYAKQALDGLPK